MRAFLHMNNAALKAVIDKSGIFEVSDSQADEDQLLICDHVKDAEHVKARKRVYIAADRFEYTFDMKVFEPFEYLLGFGEFFYGNILRKSPVFHFDPSKVFDGFIPVPDNGAPLPDCDVLVLASGEYTTPFEICALMNFLDILRLTRLGLKVGTNIEDPRTFVAKFKHDEPMEIRLLVDVFMSEPGFAGMFKDVTFGMDVHPDTVPTSWINKMKRVLVFDSNRCRWHADGELLRRKMLFLGSTEGLAYQMILDRSVDSLILEHGSWIALQQAVENDENLASLVFALPGKRLEKFVENANFDKRAQAMSLIHKRLIGDLTDDLGVFSSRTVRKFTAGVSRLVNIPREGLPATSRDVTDELLSTLTKIKNLGL